MGEIEKIEYNGEELSITAIAKQEGIDRGTLARHYKATGNIYEAVKLTKQNSREKIEYKGEELSLRAIAKKEGISITSLTRNYNKIGNIYEAVELSKKRIIKKVEYYGGQLSLDTIAKQEDITRQALAKYYEKTQNIYEAVKLAKQNLIKKTEYNGEELSINAIAKREGIIREKLKRYYNKTGNIYKAVFMAKIQRTKSNSVKLKDADITIYDLSLILGIKYSQLVNLLNRGMTIDEIKEMKNTKNKNQNITLPNGQTLLEYCIENKLNYSVIHYAINTYGKTIEEAVEEYRKNGQNIPKRWIFEKYGVLLRHLMIENQVHIDSVIRYMRENLISMSEAIEKYIIRKNAKASKLDSDWMEEIYSVLTSEDVTDDYDKFKETFYIDDNEEECVIKSYDETKILERKLLLFEIAEAIRAKAFSEEEIPKLLEVYDIKEEEIETMFLDLYSRYDEGILLGEDSKQMQRKKTINNITRRWYYLTGEEREKVITQENISEDEIRGIESLSSNIEKYKRIIHSNKEKARGKSLGTP